MGGEGARDCGGLSCTCHCMEDISFLVEHMELQLVLIRCNQGPARLVAAEYCAVGRLHILAAEGTGCIYHIVDVAAVLADMLECVDVAAEIHVHIAVFPDDRVQPLLQVSPLVA